MSIADAEEIKTPADRTKEMVERCCGSWVGEQSAEVIYERADADQPFMGLTTFEGELPAIKDQRKRTSPTP